MKRQIIYGVIYVGIAIAFPALPLQGLKFLGGILGGVTVGLKDGAVDMAKSEGKEAIIELRDSLFDTLNPFN